MSNLGSYQTIVETAKAVGGPEVLADMLIQKGVKAGIRSQRSVIAVTGLLCFAIGGLIAHYAPEFGALKADKILAKDEELGEIKAEFKQIISGEDDTEEPEDLTIEYLKSRLSELENYMPEADEFEEPIATRLSYDDDLFTYMAGIDICEEDEPLIRIARNHPAYNSFSRRYHTHEPEAGELQTVKAFIRTMASYAEEEDYEIQS